MDRVYKWIENKKAYYNLLITYLEKDNDDNQDYFQLVNLFHSQKIDENPEELREFLQILEKISKNHQRNDTFIGKIKKIILYLKDIITGALSNSEIFNIFQKDKLILLHLLNNNIIQLDKYIIDIILQKINYRHFFYPEIKSLNDKRYNSIIEDAISTIGHYSLDNFEKNRQIGENDSYICRIIRQDSISEFVSHVNQTNMPFSSIIKPSIYETNSFLIKHKNTSLIEYACFFGSIQILKYLRINNVELSPSIWIYAIHSKNAELIHLLEEYKVTPTNPTFIECYKEAIKCHHNDIASYIEDNLLRIKQPLKRNSNIEPFGFHYFNCDYFSNFESKFIFPYLCLYNYLNLVRIYIEIGLFDLNRTIIL